MSNNFNRMKKLFIMFVTVVMTCVSALAQTRTVSGTVVYADDDEPIPGATVMPVGGGSGGSTDIDGKFSLNLPASCTALRVSYVGMVTQIVNIDSDHLFVRLSNAHTKLDEVMVVAYGTAKRSAYTGSAAVLDADKIEQSQVSNALNALTGKVAGVQLTNASGQPGQNTPAIRIRGISSINAGNAPLVVVDGAPYSGDINNISTQDIESMTVLKDAASNALYGARGANGVILITTKKGRTNGGAVVTVDMKWGVNTRATRDYNTINDPAAYYEQYYKALYNMALDYGDTPSDANAWANNCLMPERWNYQNPNDPYFYGNFYDYTLGYNVYSLPGNENLIGMDGRLNPNAVMGKVVDGYMLRADNWLDNAYKSSFRQEYSFSVANSTDKSNFYLSANYLDNNGITANSGYERFTGRLTADIQAKSWLKVGGNFSYTHYETKSMTDDGQDNSSGNVFAAATQIAPIYPLFIRDAAGNVMTDSYGNVRYDYGEGDNAGMERPVYPQANAIDESRLNTNKLEGNAMTGSAFVEIRFLRDFKFTSNNTVNIDESRGTSIVNPYYGMYKTSNGMITKSHARTLDYSLQQLLTWTRQFDKHDVTVLFGHESYWNKEYLLSAAKHNMYDPSNEELAGAVSDDAASTSYTTDYNNEGWLGRVQYNYDQKYFGSLSFRRDASSRFAPGHRWGSFWSMGAAWLISSEPWFEVDKIDQLKIKASYGEQGNDNIGNFRYTNVYKLINNNGVPVTVPDVMGNPDVTWEKNGNFNAGVEFSMFNSRLTGSVEGFYRRTSDMLFSFPLPASFGYSYYYANIGNMSNAGMEIDLSGDIISNKDLKWSANLNFTFYKNKITKLPDERKTTFAHELGGRDAAGFASGNYFYGEGESLYTFNMPRYAGVDHETGEPMWYQDVTDASGNVTGQTTTKKYSDATYYLCGTALPSVYGGFGTAISYKGFDLAVDFTYQLGGQVYDSDYALAMGSPTYSSHGYVIHKDVYGAWTPENKDSNIPRWQFDDMYSNSTSDRFLTSASYLSLSNINFGYSLPSKVIRPLQLEKVRFYVSCDNVALWSSRRGLDPRQSLSGESSGSYYAPIRTISGGINVTF